MQVKANSLREGQVFPLDSITLTREEIVSFAREFDPQPIHLEDEAAEKSPFGSIIASGLHPYIAFHKKYWVDMVQGDFICGLGLRNVRFFKPCYPNIPMVADLIVDQLEPKPHKDTIVVHWKLKIRKKEADEAPICTVEFSSYHYLSGRPI